MAENANFNGYVFDGDSGQGEVRPERFCCGTTRALSSPRDSKTPLPNPSSCSLCSGAR